MNRVGLKDYLLNHADDNDLLDCAKAWDAANEYGQFDTYKSVEEAAEVSGWDAAQALGEAARVDQSADNFRLNGYAHLESVSDAELLDTARDSINDIVNWLEYANRYDLEEISSDIELFVDAKDPFEIINEVDCSVRSNCDAIEVNLKRGFDEATLSFSKLDDIDADKVDLANAVYATAENYYKYADGCSTEEVQAKFREALVKDDSMTFFPEFNLLVVSSSYDPSEEPTKRITAIFNASTSEIASGEFFKGCDYVSDMVFESGKEKAFAIFDSLERYTDGFCWNDPRMLMLSDMFSWSPTIDTGSIPGMIDSVTYYQKHLLSDREIFEQSHGSPASEVHVGKSRSDAKELLDKLTSSETVSYFPEFNLLVTTTDYVPSGLHDRETAVFNVFPSELAYGKLFQGFENVADIPYSGPVIDPIGLCATFPDDGGEERSADVSLRYLAALLSGADVISTQSVPELLDTMADRFGLEPEERVRIAKRAQAKEHARTQGPDIEVDIDSYNDDDFITGTVTVDGESCYFNCPNNARNQNDYDSVILEPFRPDGFEGDIEEIELPAVIDENRDIVELVVSVAVAPYMDPDKLPSREQGLDSLCEEKTDEAQSMRYGMEGVGLPMLDAAEHLANY